jgi:long-chain acyl-CoA synthetase
MPFWSGVLPIFIVGARHDVCLSMQRCRPVVGRRGAWFAQIKKQMRSMDLGLCNGLRRALQLRGYEVGLVDGNVRFAWHAVIDRVARLAGALRTAGVSNGERVVLLALNSHRSFEVFFATLQAGGVIAPINHRLSEREIAAQIADIEPTVLFLGETFAERAAELRGASGTVSTVVHLEAGASSESLLSYERLVADSMPLADSGGAGSDLACLFYTGGTTGEAKGVMLSHGNIMANSINFISNIGMDETTVHLHCGPLFHVAAAVRMFSVTQVAGTHVLLPRFEPREVLDTIERERVTLATFVPTMLRALLEQPDLEARDLSSLRYITYGAAAMPEALLREAMRRLPGVRFVQSYGMTETSPIATLLGWQDHALEGPGSAYLRSAGRPALLSEVAIVDATEIQRPAGEIGEIVIRGPMVMQGYWRRPEATAKALRGGWMHSGDIGYLDSRGYLFVVDRMKDVIISGGENVYSEEVENALASHPAVLECAVIGRPDPVWGEAVHAVVVLKPGFSVSSAELTAHCKTLIAGFKCPKSIDLRSDRLPVSGANKVLKHKLRVELLGATSHPLSAPEEEILDAPSELMRVPQSSEDW